MKVLLFNTNLATRAILTQIVTEEKIIIITDQKNIYDLITLINKDNIILYLIPSGFSFLQMFRIYKAKKIVRNIFHANPISELIFYHQAFGGFHNWIISFAHKQHVEIAYHRLIKEVVGVSCHSLRALKYKWKYRLLYKTEVEIISYGGGGLTPKLSKNFLKENEVKETWAVWDENVVSSVGSQIMNILHIPSHKDSVILLTGSILSTKRVSREEYQEKMESLIHAIGKERIICKCHPRFNDEIEIEKSLPHLPSYIPMELLASNFNIFIGFASSVLLNVAKEGKNSISLIDFFLTIDDSLRTSLHHYLDTEKIIYIKNTQELKDLVTDENY